MREVQTLLISSELSLLLLLLLYLLLFALKRCSGIDFDVVGMKNSFTSVRGRINARNANTFDKFRVVAVVVIAVVFAALSIALRTSLRRSRDFRYFRCHKLNQHAVDDEIVLYFR